MPILTLKPGHVQPIWAGHPWVFQQAVQRIEGGAVAGEEVHVVDPRGNFLGKGFYSPGSAIVVRILTRSERTVLDAAFFRARIQRAVERRARFGLPSRETDGFRIVNADGDELSGLVVDRLGDVLVVQIGTIGMKQREPMLLDLLEELFTPRAIVDRSTASIARDEGFEPREGIVRGDTAVSSMRFHERGFFYELPFPFGQKTGFYFDQRPLRGRIEQLAKGRRVLDAYCYIGAFALAAARGGATEVVACDESALALEVGAECARANGFGELVRFVRAEARKQLTLAGQEGGYDLVICDPPKLAPTRGARDGALAAYQKIAAAGCRATRPGGLFVLCSCSAAVGLDALVRALALGAREANVGATVIERFFQGIDHPVPAAFGEGLYLKSVVAFVEAI
jgi:23S rRNA (cytosine1962-C5)-methyltransferase